MSLNRTDACNVTSCGYIHNDFKKLCYPLCQQHLSFKAKYSDWTTSFFDHSSIIVEFLEDPVCGKLCHSHVLNCGTVLCCKAMLLM